MVWRTAELQTGSIPLMVCQFGSYLVILGSLEPLGHIKCISKIYRMQFRMEFNGLDCSTSASVDSLVLQTNGKMPMWVRRLVCMFLLS